MPAFEEMVELVNEINKSYVPIETLTSEDIYEIRLKAAERRKEREETRNKPKERKL